MRIKDLRKEGSVANKFGAGGEGKAADAEGGADDKGVDLTLDQLVRARAILNGGGDESSLSNELKEVALLHKEGVLSDEEFAQAKAKILN